MPPTSRSRANQGIPATATVNTGALTSASSAASSATQSAQEMTRQQQASARQNLPSIISVQILGYGNEPASDRPGRARRRRQPPRRDGSASGYDPRSVFQMLGNGDIPEAQRARLTDAERRRLSGG